MLIATEMLSDAGSVTIPRTVLERLELKAGDEVRFVETSEGIVIEKQREAVDDAPAGKQAPDLGTEIDDWSWRGM